MGFGTRPRVLDNFKARTLATYQKEILISTGTSKTKFMDKGDIFEKKLFLCCKFTSFWLVNVIYR